MKRLSDFIEIWAQKSWHGVYEPITKEGKLKFLSYKAHSGKLGLVIDDWFEKRDIEQLIVALKVIKEDL